MKRLPIFLSTLLLLPFACCYADGGMGPGPGVKGYAAACTSTGNRGTQNFENTGYDNSESWNETLGGGTIDEDDTTSPVLRGSQQLKMVYGTSAAQTYKDLGSNEDELYSHFQYTTPDSTPAARTSIGRITGPSSETVATIFQESDGKLSIMASVSPYDIAITTDAMTDNTAYHIWVHYKKSSSSGANNGVVSVEFTAAGTRTPVGSGSKFASDTHDHQIQARFAGFRLDGAFTCYIDQVLFNTTSLSNVCE